MKWSFLACVVAAAVVRGQEAPPPLLADTTVMPRVVVSWETESKTVEIKGERGYRSPADKSLLGKNVDCFVALGGTRMEKGLGHPRGATLKVGLYKKDAAKPFFEGVKDGGMVTVRLEGVKMNRAVRPRPETGLMHMRYLMGDLESCGLDGNARNLIVTADATDPLQELTLPGMGRFGGLDGGAGHGSMVAKVEADGTVTMEAKFPYAMLKHTLDPNLRTKPGTFFEPPHFHVEVEVVEDKAANAAEQQTQQIKPE